MRVYLYLSAFRAVKHNEDDEILVFYFSLIIMYVQA